MALLEIKDLQVAFTTEAGTLKAVDGVSFEVESGRTLGVVGESGCGKSVTAMSVLRLIPNPPGDIVGGQILWKGEDILALPQREMTAIRGKQIAMIFQDPMASLNPVMTIEKQLGEVLKLRFGMERPAARARALEMLAMVGISEAAERLRQYPHELSGGMKQRIMIAMALMCEPGLLIADEPTTALDVTISAQILQLMKELQQKMGSAIILITHDMGVIAETCDDVAVMYAGRVVESCPIMELFEHTRHPYTRGLLDSIPKKGMSKSETLATIEGTVPSLLSPPKGCRFADRCLHRSQLSAADQKRCVEEDPGLRDLGAGHMTACHFPLEDGA
ncbi:ABC transporter ATP-binding protein [Candidatus Poribacteria bacterium]|nr:ABC transporter ATP-binding protein [Candidatus Poribacteria bacterium]